MESPGPDPDWAVIAQEARAYNARLEAGGCTHQAAQEIFNLPVEQAVAGAHDLVGSLRSSLDYTINHFRETADMLERANWRLAQYQFAVSIAWMEIKEERDVRQAAGEAVAHRRADPVHGGGAGPEPEQPE